MKQMLCIAVAVFCVFLCSNNAEAIIGVPAASGERRLTVSVEADFLKSTYADEDQNEVAVEGENFLVGLRYGLFDSVDLFAKIGLANYWSHEAQVFIKKGFGTDDAPAYAAGVKARLATLGGWRLGAVAQAYTHSGRQEEQAGTWSGTLDLALTSYTLAIGAVNDSPDKLKPYFGLHYSRLEGRAEVEHGFSGSSTFAPVSVDVDFEAADELGAFAGVQYKFTDNFHLELEARFVSEESFGLLLGYTF
jgi:opacity protein-like surface antigen